MCGLVCATLCAFHFSKQEYCILSLLNPVYLCVYVFVKNEAEPAGKACETCSRPAGVLRVGNCLSEREAGTNPLATGHREEQPDSSRKVKCMHTHILPLLLTETVSQSRKDA